MSRYPVGGLLQVRFPAPQFGLFTPDACKHLVGTVCALKDFPDGLPAGLPASAKCKVVRALPAADGLSADLLLLRVR